MYVCMHVCGERIKRKNRVPDARKVSSVGFDFAMRSAMGGRRKEAVVVWLLTRPVQMYY